MSLKPIIKSAREALDRKDYDYALQLCTDALVFEPENYFLLVFKAVALTNKNDLEASLQSYSLATKSQPDNPLAFQGIINLYESKGLKIDSRYTEALESLSKILFNQKDASKHQEIIMKRLKIFKEEFNDQAECLKLLYWLSSSEAHQFYSNNPPDIKKILQEQVAILVSIENGQVSKEVEMTRTKLGADPLNVLIEKAEVNSFKSSPLTKIYEDLIEMGELKYVEVLASRLLRICLSDYADKNDQNDFELKKLYKYENSSIIKSILRNILAVYSDDANENNTLDTNNDINGPVDLYFKLIATFKSNIETKYGEVNIKIIQMEKELMSKILQWKRAFPSASYDNIFSHSVKIKLLTLFNLKRFDDAFTFLSETNFTNEQLIDDFLFEPTLSILEHGHEFNRLIILIEEKLMQVDPETPELIIRLIKILIRMARLDEASEYIGAIRSAYQNMNQDLEAEVFHLSGTIMWLQSKRTKSCLSEFLSAAKANPSEGMNFYWIAKYYWRIERDGEKAIKCLNRAISLDSTHTNLSAILLLVEIKIINGLCFYEEIDLMKSFTLSNARNRRLFYYLGVVLFKSKNLENNFLEACTAFQSALKASLNSNTSIEDSSDPKISDSQCLFWLSESFSRSNRLSSAAKAFERLAQNQEVSKHFAIDGLANIHLRSNNPIGAMDLLDSLDLKLNGSSEQDLLLNTKIFLSKVKTGISLSREYLRTGRFQSAIPVVLKNLLLLLEVVEINSNLAPAWHFAAECFMIAQEYVEILNFPLKDFKRISNSFKFPQFNSGLSEIVNLVSNSPKDDGEEILFISSIKCVLSALSTKNQLEHPDISIFWLQLSQILCKKLNFVPFAISSAQNALKITKSAQVASAAHHVLAKIFCDKNSSLAQHHFIRSLKIYETAQVWIDLGLFYRSRCGDWQLANDSLQRALALDPENVVAAFELSAGSATIEGRLSCQKIAIKSVSYQPVQFVEQIAQFLVEDFNCEPVSRKYALIYLHRRFCTNLNYIYLICDALESEEKYKILLQFITDLIENRGSIFKNDSKLTELKVKYSHLSEKEVVVKSCSCKEFLDFLNSSMTAEWSDWLMAPNLDCEYLLTRPENDLAQSGWRAVVDGLLPTEQVRTKAEEQLLHKVVCNCKNLF